MNPHAPVAQLDRALPSEGKGHTFESCRVRQLATAKVSAACAASRRLAAASRWLPNENIENNPMQRRPPPAWMLGTTFDMSGKSAALLHRRTIRQTPVGAQWRAVRRDFGRKSDPQLKLHWPVKLQWLAAARDRLRVPSRRASDARAGECRHEHRSEPKYGNGDHRTRSNQGCRSRSRRYRFDIISGDLPAAPR